MRRLGRQRDPRCVMLARGDDQQAGTVVAQGAASAASKRSTRTSPTPRTSCAIARIFRFADEEVEHRVALAANEVRLIGGHAHVRVRQPPTQASCGIGGIEQLVTSADDHDERCFDPAQLRVAEHRDLAKMRTKATIDRVEQIEHRAIVGRRMRRSRSSAVARRGRGSFRGESVGRAFVVSTMPLAGFARRGGAARATRPACRRRR
ncbi:hypothetical protein [Burkholderia sp. ABCPW 14]|uniref:hypothetical protein n=1 Tax=Burkholderia sp. ABCPW 14 TaxID=1637860 RepID=UPI0012E3601E|nr:hypothetical protein [Burkholderia sp. ABCPW 14]